MNRTRQTLKRKIAAIMAADVAEYTRIIAEDEEEGIARLESYRRVFDDLVVRSGGRVFNSGGDSLMCEFPSAVEATRCAIDIQESLRTRNLACPANRQMHFRIGITIGDVIERDGDLLGDGVNVAARLQTLAEPGSICVARNVQEAVANKIAVPFRDLGYREVKNLPHPVHAFLIETAGAKAISAPLTAPLSRDGKARSLILSPAIGLAAGMVIAVIAGGLYLTSRQDPAIEHNLSGSAPPAVSQPSPQPRPGESVVVKENLTPALAFEKLSKSGGLVNDAASAPELYHNARLFEARGESANARRDYLAFAALGTNHIDPLLRLAALVRAQDGRADAREIFAAFAKGKSRAAGLVHALQFDGGERVTRLAAFAEANPDFAPTYAMLAVELSEDRQNLQTIGEKRRELAALGRFLAAERDGNLVPYFLDQSVLTQWLDNAHRRDTALKAFFAEKRDHVSAQFERTNSGWTSIISLPEPATQLEYRLGANAEFRATGFLQVLDPRTGKQMPNPSFELAHQQEITEIALRYIDAKGIQSSVATIPFDPKAVMARVMRDMLEQTAASWLAFGTGQNSHQLYFTHLVSLSCAIEKAEIGFNGEVPHEVLALPACDPTSPYGVPRSPRPSVILKAGAESATVRLTFVGGDQSAIRTFQRPR